MRELPIIFSGPMVRAILDGRKTMTRRTSGLECINEHPNWWERAITLLDDTWSFWTPDAPDLQEFAQKAYPEGGGYRSRYQVGDYLWVRETWAIVHACVDPETGHADEIQLFDGGPIPKIAPGPYWSVAYEADFNEIQNPSDDRFAKKWRSPIHMPKWAARIWLEVIDVKCERVQEISEGDAVAEGVEPLFSPEIVARRPELASNPMPWLNYLWHGHFNHGMGNKRSDAWPHQYSSYKTAKESFSSLWELIHGPGAWERNPFVWVYSFRRIEK